MQLEQWLAGLVRRRLPVLPSSRRALGRLLAEGDALSLEALANLTLSDPLMLFDLMRLCGSVSRLEASGKLPAVEQMLMLLGVDTVRSRFAALDTLSVAPGQLDADVAEEVRAMLGRGRIAAQIVKGWLALAGEPRVEDCFIAAEIYNLPACVYLLDSNTLTGKPPLQAAADAFGTDYPLLLSAFVRTLGLPAALGALLGPGSPNRQRGLLKLAVATAEGVDQGVWRAPWLAGVEAAARLCGASLDDALEVVQRAVLQVARSGTAPEYGFAARRLLALEGPVPLPLPRAHAAAAIDEARPDAAIREALRHLANDLGFSRVLYYRVDPAAACLRLRFQVGVREGEPLARLAPELGEGCLLSTLMSRAQCLFTPAHALEQLASRYGDALLTALGPGDKAFLSLWAQGVPLGLFVADNGAGGRAIDPATFNQFKALAAGLPGRTPA